MISENLSNSVFYSAKLPEVCPESYRSMTAILDKYGVRHSSLIAANDIWVRDFMPLHVFKYIKHEIHDGTPYTEEGAKELKEIGIHIILHPVITASLIALMDVALGQKFPSFFTGTTYIGVLLGSVLVLVSLILKYGAELEENIKNKKSDEEGRE